MNDREWYLNVGGKQSGPVSAQEIVGMVRAGQIPLSAQVTAARMAGDWVDVKDLVDAYDELYTKKPPPMPPGRVPPPGPARSVSAAEPDFHAPPRPTEQLEATKTIYLNRAPTAKAPDATDALFHAIQAVRGKAQSRSSAASASAPMASYASAASSTREGGMRPRVGPRLPSVLFLVLTLTAIFGGTVYGISHLLGKRKASVERAVPTAAIPARPVAPGTSFDSPPPIRTNDALLGGTAPRAALTPAARAGSARAGSVSPAPRTLPTTNSRNAGTAARVPPPESNPGFMSGAPNDGSANPRIDRAGGARYRDERDPPLRGGRDFEDDFEDEEFETAPARMPMPMDPSQIQPQPMIQDPMNPNGRVFQNPNGGGFPPATPEDFGPEQ